MANSVKVRKVGVKELFSELRKPIDRTDWISGPAIVNAFYEPAFNQICKLPFLFNIFMYGF